MTKTLMTESQADDLENLGEKLYAQGDFAAARRLQGQVLAARQQLLGPQHRDTLRAMVNLALTLHDQGDFAGARELHEQVLAGRWELLGPQHPHTSVAAWHLLTTLFNLNDRESVRGVVAHHLAWLTAADPASLHPIQQIRQMLRKGQGLD